jgi:hypothetical protein
MANRNFASGGKIYSMHVMPVMVDCSILIGATGAVTSIKGPLVSSVTRMSTGIYKVNLTDAFNNLFMAMGSCASPSSGLSGIATIEIANAQAAQVSTSTPSITIKTLDAAGALADPASGSTVSMLAYLSNSSIQVGGE